MSSNLVTVTNAGQIDFSSSARAVAMGPLMAQVITQFKSRPDSLRLLSVPKIRGSSSGTSVLIGWRREEVCAGLAPGAAGEFLPWRPRQSSSALADVPGAWWSQYGIKIYSFESQKDEEHPCFGFISLSLTILELSKKRHYFPALPRTLEITLITHRNIQTELFWTICVQIERKHIRLKRVPSSSVSFLLSLSPSLPPSLSMPLPPFLSLSFSSLSPSLPLPNSPSLPLPFSLPPSLPPFLSLSLPLYPPSPSLSLSLPLPPLSLSLPPPSFYPSPSLYPFLPSLYPFLPSLSLPPPLSIPSSPSLYSFLPSLYSLPPPSLSLSLPPSLPLVCVWLLKYRVSHKFVLTCFCTFFRVNHFTTRAKLFAK